MKLEIAWALYQHNITIFFISFVNIYFKFSCFTCYNLPVCVLLLDAAVKIRKPFEMLNDDEIIKSTVS